MVKKVKRNFSELVGIIRIYNLPGFGKSSIKTMNDNLLLNLDGKLATGTLCPFLLNKV